MTNEQQDLLMIRGLIAGLQSWPSTTTTANWLSLWSALNLLQRTEPWVSSTASNLS
mgnify:CR=1 FL=1